MMDHAAPSRLGGIFRIAVLRANALGDFVFTLPALDALRHAYPHAEIVLLGAPWHARFLQDRPGPVDRVVVVPFSRGVRAAPPGQPEQDDAELDVFFERMRAERFDLALQLHGGGRNSNPFVRRLGARVTAGLRTPDAPPLDVNVPYVYWQHEVMRNLEVARAVGAPPVRLEAHLDLTDADVRESQALLPDGPPIVALHPGAGDGRRRWSPSNFARVGDALARRGLRVVVTGTPDEAPLVQAVLDGMTEAATDACGKLSLGGLAGLMSRCALVVSNDSGPLHVAHAVGAPTVGIFWCGNVINAAPVFRTRHRPVMSWRLDCPECGVNCMQGTCEHRASFVDDVTPAEVLEAAGELLEGNGVTERA